MTTKRNHQEMRNDVIQFLSQKPHTITQVLSWCNLKWAKTQELLGELIEEGDVVTFMDESTNGRQCIHYAISALSEFNKNCEENK